MPCKICGDENARFLARAGVSLCAGCAEGTPAKVSRPEFYIRYFGKLYADVPLQTRRDFYEDYQLSTLTLPQYIRSTTRELEE